MPWYVPNKYFDLYPLDRISLPKTLEGDLKDLPAAGVRMALPQGDHARMLRSGRWKEAVRAYLASISFADFQVGRLIKALDNSLYANDTLIVLWGDHGWHLGEKEHWRKFALWEEATKAPLLFVVPHVTKPNTPCDTPVDFMNIYPTLADICGLSLLPQLEGVSMKALLQDPNVSWERPALTTHGRLNHSLRTHTHRYIRYADGSEELYDHRVDLMEWNNIANTSEGRGVINQLLKWLPASNVPDAPSDPKVRSNPIINPALPNK